jgi:hypothetical protein
MAASTRAVAAGLKHRSLQRRLQLPDLRVSRTFALEPGAHRADGRSVQLFNTTNILGVSVVNYSGFSNVLVRDSDTPGTPGFLTSSRFGQAISTAGGVFGTEDHRPCSWPRA